MKIIFPPALHKGATIGIMAPSSRVDKDLLASASARLEQSGFKIHIHPQTRARSGQSAGTAQQKADALHALYKNPDIKAILTAAGGNQTAAMLDRLDFALIKKSPKIIMGFSDVTVLLNAIYEKTGCITFHGPTAHTIGRRLPAVQLKQSLSLLSGKPADIPLTKARILNPGTAHGPLIGGNLSLLTSLLGTRWQPDFKNAVLFLEDCGDELSRVDRMLHHLCNAGAFAQISGLLVGGFTGLTDTGGKPYGKTVPAMIRALTEGLNIPIVANAPFGHANDLYTLPLGAPARLTAGAKGCALKLDGPAVTL